MVVWPLGHAFPFVGDGISTDNICLKLRLFMDIMCFRQIHCCCSGFLAHRGWDELPKLNLIGVCFHKDTNVTKGACMQHQVRPIILAHSLGACPILNTDARATTRRA